MKAVLSIDQIRRLRIRAQRLDPAWAEAPAQPGGVLSAVCGVQAQDLPAALLATGVRGELTLADIEAALHRPKTIARTWGMRGTLHLLAAQDICWLVPLLGPVFISGGRRRFEKLGWDAEGARRGLRLLQKQMELDGALTREQIVQLLKENKLPWEGQAPFHLIVRAAMEGILCVGPDRDKKPTYVAFQDWAGELEPLPHEEGLARLIYRYLSAYGPARPEDMAAWSGLKLSDIRKAWAQLGKQVCGVEGESGPLWIVAEQLPWLDEISTGPPVVRLLPRFDNYLLGYASREFAIDERFARRVHPGGGMLSASLMVDGALLGVWKTVRRRKSLEIIAEPFEPLPAEIQPGLEAEAERMARFLGESTPVDLVIRTP